MTTATDWEPGTWADTDVPALVAEVRRLRGAVDAVRLLCDQTINAPMPDEPEECDDAGDGYCHYDARLATARDLRRALDAALDPKEQT